MDSICSDDCFHPTFDRWYSGLLYHLGFMTNMLVSCVFDRVSFFQVEDKRRGLFLVTLIIFSCLVYRIIAIFIISK